MTKFLLESNKTVLKNALQRFASNALVIKFASFNVCCNNLIDDVSDNDNSICYCSCDGESVCFK